MAKLTRLLFCVLSIGFYSYSNAQQPQIEIFNTNNISTSNCSFSTKVSIPSISHMTELDLNLDRRHVCYTGVWLGYLGLNYGSGVGVFPQNDFTCLSTYGHDVSYRNVGHPTDISISTISLFEDPWFVGSMSQYHNDVSDYRSQFQSVIITPPGEATFYTQANYGGLSICLKPTVGATHYTLDTLSFGIEPGQIKSFKFGCYSENVFYSSDNGNFLNNLY